MTHDDKREIPSARESCIWDTTAVLLLQTDRYFGLVVVRVIRAP